MRGCCYPDVVRDPLSDGFVEVLWCFGGGLEDLWRIHDGIRLRNVVEFRFNV